MGIWRELEYSLRRIKRIRKLEQKYQNVEVINDSYKDEKISFPYYENPLVSIIIPYFNQEIFIPIRNFLSYYVKNFIFFKQ